MQTLSLPQRTGWAYSSTAETPGDLGYWVGFRIAKGCYRNAADKRLALRDILEMDDAKGFLAKSGWHPAIELDQGSVQLTCRARRLELCASEDEPHV
jgi:hypothetical protein